MKIYKVYIKLFYVSFKLSTMRHLQKVVKSRILNLRYKIKILIFRYLKLFKSTKIQARLLIFQGFFYYLIF